MLPTRYYALRVWFVGVSLTWIIFFALYVRDCMVTMVCNRINIMVCITKSDTNMYMQSTVIYHDENIPIPIEYIFCV